RGRVKLVDFGLARQFSSRLTDPRVLLGSVEFMAPEQSHDPSAVGPAADVYGLGATLFWLLTAEPPYAVRPTIGEALPALQAEAAAARFPEWAGLVDGRFLAQLDRCVPLHDVGKIGLPDDVLLKPGPLDPLERALVQTHPLIGDRMLEALAREYGQSLDFLGT